MLKSKPPIVPNSNAISQNSLLYPDSLVKGLKVVYIRLNIKIKQLATKVTINPHIKIIKPKIPYRFINITSDIIYFLYYTKDNINSQIQYIWLSSFNNHNILIQKPYKIKLLFTFLKPKNI
jgi:hypothetical protein